MDWKHLVAAWLAVAEFELQQAQRLMRDTEGARARYRRAKAQLELVQRVAARVSATP